MIDIHNTYQLFTIEMAQLVHERSQLGAGMNSMPHTGIPDTDISYLMSYEDLYLPDQQAYGVGQVVTWTIPQTSDYTDLSKSYVRVRGTWTHANNSTALATTDDMAPVKTFPYTLFQLVDFYLNGQKVTPSRGGDPVICYVNRNCLNSAGVAENSVNNGATTINNSVAPVVSVVNPSQFDLGLSLDFEDTYLTAVQNGYSAPSDELNVGFISRSNIVINDTQLNQIAGTATELEYCYVPQVGGWQLGGKLLPDRVQLKLELTVADPSYYVIGTPTVGPQPANTWTFNPSKMELVLHHVRMNNEVVAQNSAAMLVQPYLAPNMMKIYQKIVVPQGQASIDQSNVYSGPLPKFVVCLLQPQNNASNNYLFNPLDFPDLMTDLVQNPAAGAYVKNAYILVNGRQIPRRPYEATSIVEKTREYRAFLQACELWGNKLKPTLSFKQFCASPIRIFFVDALEDEETWSPTENCVVEVHFELSAASTTPGLLHVISYVPAVIEIDGARAVKQKTMSGALLQFE